MNKIAFFVAMVLPMTFQATPINDLSAGLYLGEYQGGLYEHGTNTVPVDHEDDGLEIADTVEPLDVNGNPSPNGNVIVLSMGMSNAAIEFGSFIPLAKGVDKVRTVLWNGAQSNQDLPCWTTATGPAPCDGSPQNEYDRIASGLQAADLSPLQVQVAWIDNANGRARSGNRGCLPTGTLCVSLCAIRGCVNTAQKTDALNVEMELGENLRAAKQRFPNLQLVFFSARVYGGYANSESADPEPFAYEKGFAVKWLIQAQINQQRTGTVDPVAGDLSYAAAPWVAWGPYFWADGSTRRSDGLVWLTDDFDFTGLHLSTEGGQDTGQLLLGFFTTSEFTGWF